VDDQGLTFYTTEEGLPDNRVFAFAEDAHGQLWSGTRKGIARFDGAQWIPVVVDGDLDPGFVGALFCDSTGTMWFGTGYSKGLGYTAGSGVLKYLGETFQSYSTSVGVTGLAEDQHGRIWMNTWAGTLYFDGDQVEDFAPIQAYGVDVMEDLQGRIWFCTGNGVYVYDGKELVHYTIHDGMVTDVIPTGYIDRDGRAWLGTFDRGVMVYDGQHFKTFTTKDGLVSNYVYGIIQDQQGIMWFATRGSGVSRYDGTTFTTFTTKEGLAHNSVMDITEDRNGHLWFATEGGGVSRWDGQGFTTFNTENGLGHNRVPKIMEDRNGHLWFSTFGGGVSRYDGLVFQTLLQADGLIHNGVHQVIEGRDGTYWIGTEVGFTHFQPPRAVPDIRLTQVFTDREYSPTAEIQLTTEQDYLAFQFQGRSLITRANQIAYVYRLQGHETEWQVTRQTQVVYRDLPQGTYIFEVKAVDRDLNYSAQAAQVRITIHPPYGRWAFNGLLAVALLGLVGTSGYAYRRRKENERVVRQHNQRLEQQN